MVMEKRKNTASPPALPRREGAGRRQHIIIISHFQMITFPRIGSLPTGEGGGRGLNYLYPLAIQENVVSIGGTLLYLLHLKPQSRDLQSDTVYMYA